MSESPGAAVLARHRDRLMAMEGVSGVAYGLSPKTGRPCILVYGRPMTELPVTLEGIVVELVPTEGFQPR